MARLNRLPFLAFGWHVVRLNGAHQRRIVTDCCDIQCLTSLLGQTIRDSGARLHAAYLSRHEVYLALQIGEQPLNTVIGRFQHAYARWFNRTHREHGPLFKVHHRELLFQHQTWLVRVVHYIHWIRRLHLQNDDSDGLWWCSDTAYRTQKRLDGLTTNVVLNMLARGARRHVQIEAYRRVFDVRPAPEHVQLIENGSPEDPRILGDPAFVRNVWRLSGQVPARTSRGRPVPQDIEAEVERVVAKFRELCGQGVSGTRHRAWWDLVTVDRVRSRSRERPLPMVRALCVSSLAAGKIASPSEAAAFLGSGRRALSAARRRFYEQRFAEAFGVSAEALFRPRRESLVAGRVGGGSAQGRGGASSSADLLRRFMAGATSGAASGAGCAKTRQAPEH